MKQYIKQYIGLKEIVNVILLEEKTYLGEDRVEVEFKTDNKEQYPLKVLDAIATKEVEKDLNIIREKRVQPVLLQILTLLTESELSRSDTRHLFELLPSNLQMSLDRTIEKLFGKNIQDVSLYDMHKELTK